MSAAFTPGPWSVYVANYFDGIPDTWGISCGDPRGAVCFIENRVHRGPKQSEANARLIAAAPAMFEALTEARELVCKAAETGFAEAECRAIYAHNGKITAALKQAMPLPPVGIGS